MGPEPHFGWQNPTLRRVAGVGRRGRGKISRISARPREQLDPSAQT